MQNKIKYDVNLINKRHNKLAAWLPDGMAAFARFEDGVEGQPSGGAPAPVAVADPPAGDPPATPPATPPVGATPPAASGSLLDTAGLVNPDGTFIPEWYKSDNLPEEVRGSESLAVIKNLSDLAKRTVHAEKMVGKNKIAVPKPGADQSEWDAFQTAVGQANPALAVPAEAKDYKFDIPEGMESLFSDERMDASRTLAKEVGVTQAQFEKFMQADAAQAAELQAAQQQEVERKRDADELALKKEWGAAYDERIHVVKRLISEAFGSDNPGKMNFLQKFASDPDFVRFAADVGSKMVESKALVAELSQSTPNESLARIKELEATPGYRSPSSDMTDAQRTEITNQIREQYKIAYPEQ